MISIAICFSIAICRQSKTLFLAIFDLRSSTFSIAAYLVWKTQENITRGQRFKTEPSELDWLQVYDMTHWWKMFKGLEPV